MLILQYFVSLYSCIYWLAISLFSPGIPKYLSFSNHQDKLKSSQPWYPFQFEGLWFVYHAVFFSFNIIQLSQLFWSNSEGFIQIHNLQSIACVTREKGGSKYFPEAAQPDHYSVFAASGQGNNKLSEFDQNRESEVWSSLVEYLRIWLYTIGHII